MEQKVLLKTGADQTFYILFKFANSVKAPKAQIRKKRGKAKHYLIELSQPVRLYKREDARKMSTFFRGYRLKRAEDSGQ